ncbi:hypothetical protein [Aquimarina sp. 2201CG14-23]|uniref:hypothetical protein n=1 Tax=Aquimarina mycalae TaxID=3040073 RepID=UPI002477EED4|nr:hypothetical protein [Aquimarina sp. 2201CG14-23]MDH7445313.1 hypothetical protein [Aquimarina sp. 2201CG14-23]
MLKGKKGLYVLLPLVVCIWGAIIFQVVDAFSDEDPVIANTNPISFATIKTKEREKFTIGEVDRDPFLGTIYKPKKVINQNPKPVAKKQEIVWPSIRYKGLVSAQNNSSAIFMVEINGSDQLMRINESFSEVKLIKGTTGTIKLRYKGSTKQFQILN